jgi:hypothetical protein
MNLKAGRNEPCPCGSGRNIRNAVMEKIDIIKISPLVSIDAVSTVSIEFFSPLY